MASVEEIARHLDPLHRVVYDFFENPSDREGGICSDDPEAAPFYSACGGSAIDSFTPDGSDCFLRLPHDRAGVVEEVSLSPYDYRVDRYSAELGGISQYILYPMRDGRTWLKTTQFSSFNGDPMTRSEVLSSSEAGLVVRQIFRRRDSIQTNPFQVNPMDQTIHFGTATVKVISEHPLALTTLRAIGMGLAHPQVDRAASSSPKGPLLVLVAPDVEGMQRLCDRVRRCSDRPTREVHGNILSEAGADFDPLGHLIRLYVHTTGVGYKAADALAREVYHESWHLLWHHLFFEAHADSSGSYDALIPTLTGFFMATGAPEDLVTKLFFPSFMRAPADESDFSRLYWSKSFPMGSAESLEWTFYEGLFPDPAEWYARLGTCIFWEEKCRERLESFFPPIVSAFEAHARIGSPAGRRNVLLESYQASAGGIALRCAGGGSSQVTSYSNDDPPIGTYFLGPYRIEEGNSTPHGLLTAGCRIFLGGEVIPWGDPDFRHFLAHYNMVAGDIGPVHLAAAETYIKVLDECGGWSWWEGEVCPGVFGLADDLSREVGFGVRDRNFNRSLEAREVVELARSWREAPPEQRGDLLEGIAEDLRSYFSMECNIDLPMETQVDSLISILRQELGDPSYEMMIGRFLNFAVDFLQTYPQNEDKRAVVYWMMERLFAGAGQPSPMPPEEARCRP